VDKKKVFLVGHSMGASQAVAAAGRSPDRFAAVAALGGGGRVAAGDGLKKVPFFVGVGDKDFALPGAEALDGALRKAGVKKVTYKKYDDVEHLLIVQLALRDVFKVFDTAAKGE
jgi:predicted peptidase